MLRLIAVPSFSGTRAPRTGNADAHTLRRMIEAKWYALGHAGVIVRVETILMGDMALPVIRSNLVGGLPPTS